MAELFRLACMSFLFGGALYLGLRLVRFLLSSFSISDKSFSTVLSSRLPRGWERYFHKKDRRPLGGIMRFLLDFLICTVFGICFIIFLFWQADGIPRLFVFFAAGGGAYIVKRFLSPLFFRIEKLFEEIIAFAVLWLSVPAIRMLSLAVSRLIAFFKKIALFFIKRGKRFYTICTAKKYSAKAEKSLKSEEISLVMREAIFGKEGK